MNLEQQSTKEIIEILRRKPEIDFMVEYHQDTIVACGEKVTAIDKALKWGKKEAVFMLVFGFIPIYSITRLSDLDKANLKIQKKDTQHEIVRKKEVFEKWLNDSAEYDKHFKLLEGECKNHFDWLYKKAEEVAEDDFILKQKMVKYDNKADDMTHKVLFYAHMKNAVENYHIRKKLKFVLGVN